MQDMQHHSNKKGITEQSPPSAETSETAKLYGYYAARLLDYFYQHLSSLPDAEDLLLEVFLTAWQHEPTLRNMLEQQQRAWLWTVARNKMIDYYRRTGRRRHVPLEHIADLLDNDERMPESLALRGEEHATLHFHLTRMSTLQQEVLQLRFTAGLRCAEIAAVLNRSEGAIRTMLSRALNILRHYYEQYSALASKAPSAHAL